MELIYLRAFTTVGVDGEVHAVNAAPSTLHRNEAVASGDSKLKVGVVSLVRVMNGSLRKGQKIRMWSTGRAHTVDKLGRFTPKSLASESLETGEVGFVIAGIKEIDGAALTDRFPIYG